MPGAKADPARRQFLLIRAQDPIDAQCSVDGAARVVLVSDGGTEQRHDPIAEKLVDGTLVAMDFRQHEIEGSAHQLVDLLDVEALRQRGEPGDVHEKHGHLFALALQRGPRGEDLLGKVLGRVALW